MRSPGRWSKIVTRKQAEGRDRGSGENAVDASGRVDTAMGGRTVLSSRLTVGGTPGSQRCSGKTYCPGAWRVLRSGGLSGSVEGWSTEGRYRQAT